MTLSKLLATASAAALLAPCLLATAAQAQTAPAASDTAPQASEAGSSSGDIVVTARRQEESLQDVPVSIIAFSQAALKDKAITNSFDLERAVPGLQVQAGAGSTNFPTFGIRGRGLTPFAAGGSVETYFADVPLSAPYQAPTLTPQYFDLQSVQVLKGPQGTLFGRATTGGAVLFVPQAPTDKFEGYARVQVGDYNNLQLEGAVNIPLGEIGALRVAGFRWSRAGYAHTLSSAEAASILGGPPITDYLGNPLPRQSTENQDVTGLRATLLLRPVEGLENSTIFAYNRSNNRSTPFATAFGPAYTFFGGLYASLYPNLWKTLGPRTGATNIDLGRLPEENWAVINTTTLDLTENLTLKNIFGYINAKGVRNSSSDVDGTPTPFLGAGIDLLRAPRQSKNEQITNETQLRGDFLDGRLTGLVGFLFDKRIQPGGDDINGGGPTREGGASALWLQEQGTAYSVFGSATFKVTDQLSLTAGARHNWVKVTAFSIEAAPQNAAAVLANPNVTPSGAQAAGWTFLNPGQLLTSSFQGDNYNIGLDYRVSDRILVYGGYRHGWKPGGFNAKPPAGLPEQASFGPERVDNFYAGVKSQFDLGSMPVRLNLEAYRDNYAGKQQTYLTVSTLGLATVTVNVPKMYYQGLDVDAAFEPTKWLELDANYSYIDAKIVSWPDPTYGATFGLVPDLHLDLAQNPVGGYAPHKFSATARFHTELPNGWGEVSLAPTVSYQSLSYYSETAFLLPQGQTAFLLPSDPLFNSAANGGSVLGSRTLVDLNIAWKRVLGSRVDAALHVTNLTDQVYLLGTTGTLSFGVEAGVYGPPRMVSFDLSMKF